MTDKASTSEAPAAAGSWLEKIRAQRELKLADRTFEQSIAGYDPEVVVRYRRLGVDQTADIMNRDTSEMEVNADLVIAGCVGVFVREGAQLHPFIGDEAPKMDYRLRDALGIDADEAPSARKICRAVFADDWELKRHASKLLDWSRGVNASVEEEIAGE